MEEITLQVQRDEQSGWLVASPPKGKISAACSKSRRRSQFTLTKAPRLVESASTSSATLSWFKREASPGHLGSRNTQTITLEQRDQHTGCTALSGGQTSVSGKRVSG